MCWYNANWKNPGTYIVILLMSPGIWILVVPWMAWKTPGAVWVVAKKFVEKRKERRETKILVLEPGKIFSDFAGSRKESEAFLKKLESKFQKEGETT